MKKVLKGIPENNLKIINFCDLLNHQTMSHHFKLSPQILSYWEKASEKAANREKCSCFCNTRKELFHQSFTIFCYPPHPPTPPLNVHRTDPIMYEAKYCVHWVAIALYTSSMKWKFINVVWGLNSFMSAREEEREKSFAKIGFNASSDSIPMSSPHGRTWAAETAPMSL